MDLTEAKRFVEREKRVGSVHPHPGMVLSLVTEIERLQDISAALTRSVFDVSPCSVCGKATVCLPEGLLPLCNQCEAAEAKEEGR